MFVRKHRVRPFNMVIRTGGVGAVLARLIRTIMYDLGIVDQDRYDSLMIRYIQRARFLPDAAKQEAARIGLSKELMKESITWKTLLKGIEFLNVKQVEFTVAIERGGVVSDHVVSFQSGTKEEPGKILGVLMSNIFHALRIQEDEYSRLMDAYIERSRAVVHKRQKATIRASVSKELLKGSMTWKTFMKGLVFIGVSRFTIRVKLYHAAKPATIHEIAVAVDGFDESDADND